jgi:hypothetical protein
MAAATRACGSARTQSGHEGVASSGCAWRQNGTAAACARVAAGRSSNACSGAPAWRRAAPRASLARLLGTAKRGCLGAAGGAAARRRKLAMIEKRAAGMPSDRRRRARARLRAVHGAAPRRRQPSGARGVRAGRTQATAAASLVVPSWTRSHASPRQVGLLPGWRGDWRLRKQRRASCMCRMYTCASSVLSHTVRVCARCAGTRIANRVMHPAPRPNQATSLRPWLSTNCG